MSNRAYWIAALLFAALVAMKFDAHTGFTSLVRFGATWEDRRHPSLRGVPIATVHDSNGYDGQFYAQIALDPLLRDPSTSQVIDIPAYRARRILTPATASVLGLGNPWWTLNAYALINVACWFVLAWLLAKELPAINPVNVARWIGCMFGMGILESVRQSLTDLPALLLLFLAVTARAQGSRTTSTTWLALGNLAKESNLLGTVALCLGETKRPLALKKILSAIALATLPLLAWACYVALRLPSPIESGGLGNLTWPLAGVFQHLKICIAQLLAGNWDGRFSMGLLGAVGFVVQAWVLVRQPDFKSDWWRVGAAYGLLLLFLSPWVWSGYWAVSRAVLPATIAFNLLLPPHPRSFWPLWALGNITILHAVWRFI